MKDNPTYESWQLYIGKHPELFTKDEEQYIRMSRDTYKRLQDEVRAIPYSEVLSLPKDLQDTILKTLADSEVRWQEEEGRRCEELKQKVSKEHGVKVMVMDHAFFAKAREHMKPIWESWVKRTGPDARYLMDRVQDFHKKYVAAP